MKGGKHVWDKPSRHSAVLIRLPDDQVRLFDEIFIIRDSINGELLADIPYRIKHADGTYQYGRTNERGETHLIATADQENLTIEVLA